MTVCATVRARVRTHQLCENFLRYCMKPMTSTQLHTSRASHSAGLRCIASATDASSRPRIVSAVPKPPPPPPLPPPRPPAPASNSPSE